MKTRVSQKTLKMSDGLQSCAGPVGIRDGRQLKERIVQTGIVRERQPGRMATIIVHALLDRHP